MEKKHLVGAIIFLTYTLFSMSWVAGSIMTEDIMRSYNINSLASAAWMTNAITIAKILGNLLAARVLISLGLKKAVTLASVLLAAGGFAAFSESYPVYLFFRLMMGFGGAFIVVYFNPVVINYFKPSERPLVNGINASAFNFGNLLAILSTGTLLSIFHSWQNVLMVISSISFILLVAWWLFSDDFKQAAQSSDAKAKTDYTLRDGMKDPVNWILPICYSGWLFCYLSIFSLFPLVPDFAVDSSIIGSIIPVAAMMGSVVGIVIAKRFPRRVLVIRYSGLVITLCAALMISTGNSMLACAAAFLTGFFMFVPITSLMTLPQELPGVTAARVTVIFSMFWSISYGIETVLMFLAGVLADMTGNVFYAAAFAVACSVTFFISSFFLPETGVQKVSVEAVPARA
ncbi:MFS transporter [Parendozoicomonas haliclonae]|uniref:Major Facilitator Superfamily protein n=1 Tax=Parendozoicomonas haliclonae TaxID=1960125 RepID=A0A1X7ALB1_9GAMM|nr:MFS transporter [Parendozoicomonas haliclonae]SMA48756.1 Major Facilitator Superfamily protein [Parendozoicomonas haliclonae]